MLTEKGEVYAWGANDVGQIGMPTEWAPPTAARTAPSKGKGGKASPPKSVQKPPAYEEVSKIVRGMLPMKPRLLPQLLHTYDPDTNTSSPLCTTPTLRLLPQSHTSRTILFRAPADDPSLT